MFLLVPLVWAFVISLQQTNGFGDGVFVGLENYRWLVTDALFWRAALNTAPVHPCRRAGRYGTGAQDRGAAELGAPRPRMFRTVMVLPMVISGVTTALIGVLIFDQNNGIVDKLLGGRRGDGAGPAGGDRADDHRRGAEAAGSRRLRTRPTIMVGRTPR